MTSHSMLAPLSNAPPRSDAKCMHCRTPLPAGVSDDFCCAGCRSVYALLQDSGLDRYYALRGEQTLSPVGVRGQTHELLWLEAMRAELATQTGVHRFELDVQGMQCGACVWLLQTLFSREQDGHRITVNPALGRLACAVGDDFSLAHFVQAVESFGYRLGPATKAEKQDHNGLLLRTGICAALALNAMLLSSSTYFGLHDGPLYELMEGGSFVMATLSTLIGGSYFVGRAYQGLRRGVLHLDTPIALGMGLAYAGSAISVAMGRGQGSYLDTVSVFIALMLVGRLLQERLIEKNRRSLLSTDGASALLARRIRDGRTELVSCAQLRAGDELMVCPGEIVPVGVRLCDARATCSLDWINGESEPREFARDATLVAGSINVGQAAFRARALHAFERSDLDALLRDDGSGRERVRGDFWDRLGRSYSVLVLLTAALSVVFRAYRGDSLVELLDVATAVLVVTCPCAFGIATPLAYELAVAGLRRAGVFVRDGSFFERCARIRRIVFDKTGTLTTGALELCAPEQLGSLSRTELDVLYDLAAQSNHPKSVAIARAIEAREPSVSMSGEPAREEAGHGMELLSAGVRYRLGEARWAAHETGEQTVFSRDGLAIARFVTSERMRPDAEAEVASLQRQGFELWVASGDHDDRVHALAERLGVSVSRVFGDLSPEQKRALVQRVDLGRRGTMMIGDGINDGPALSSATCSGTPAIDRPFVPSRADFYYLTPGLKPVRSVLCVSRAVRHVVRSALWFALAYNVLAVGLSYAGVMRPWLAALMMPASSLAVLLYVVSSLSPRSVLWKS